MIYNIGAPLWSPCAWPGAPSRGHRTVVIRCFWVVRVVFAAPLGSPCAWPGAPSRSHLTVVSQLEHLAGAFACPGDSLHVSMSILPLLVVALAVSILVVPVSRWSQAGGKGTNLDRVFWSILDPLGPQHFHLGSWRF